MKQFEYVFSGPGFLRIVPTKFFKEQPVEFMAMKAVVAEGVERIRKRCLDISGNHVIMSLLYNAFVEAEIGVYIKERDRFGLDYLYADSGGLQAVTRGIAVNNEFKKDIYTNQKNAHFGFCFDEIPLGVKEGTDENGSHRSQYSSKLFFGDKLIDCAAHTADNIIEQTDSFKGTDTKAFYILQGNNGDEMIKWFNQGIKRMPEENWDQIQGLAPADTCMGNGAMETIEMTKACHVIHGLFPDKAKKHIHYLGVGSVSRFLPVVLLQRGGFIAPDVRISIDSTSASMAYVMGNYTDADGHKVPRGRNKKVQHMFSQFWHDMGDLLVQLSPSLDHDTFVAYTMDHLGSASDLIHSNEEYHVAMRATLTLICFWQLVGFIQRLQNALDNPKVMHSPIGMLSEVKDLSDYDHWCKQFSRYVSSKRIDRENKAASLLDLFG